MQQLSRESSRKISDYLLLSGLLTARVIGENQCLPNLVVRLVRLLRNGRAIYFGSNRTGLALMKLPALAEVAVSFYLPKNRVTSTWLPSASPTN